MDSMEASCLLYVKVGMLNDLEHSQIWLVTVNKTGIVWLTIQHDMIVNVRFMYYPGHYLRQTLAEILSLKECPIVIWESCDFGCCTLLCISENKLTTSDWLIVSCCTVGNPCNLQPDAAGVNLGMIYNLAATFAILTWSKLYIPQDFPLLFSIIFLSNATPPNHGYTIISHRGGKIRIELNDGHFVPYITHSDTARMQTPVRSLWRCQCSHKTYEPGCTFNNCLWHRKQQESKAACNWMWVYTYRGEHWSNDDITYSGYTRRATCPIYCCL